MEIKLLDHGYMRLVEHWGQGDAHVAEAGIIEAARMSTQKGFQGWGRTHTADCPAWDEGERWVRPDVACCDGKEGDEKLLRYLYEHKHSTPFEFAGAIIEVQAPIFVFREWHRHRTQSYNEMSARYSPLPDMNYVPTVERLMMNSKSNKQAGTIKDAPELTEGCAEAFQEVLQDTYQEAETNYRHALEMGVPKELARILLPVARYSRMRASTCLRNWLAFMTLRSAPGAQWEIRQYSDALETILAELFPRTMALFTQNDGAP